MGTLRFIPGSSAGGGGDTSALEAQIEDLQERLDQMTIQDGETIGIGASYFYGDAVWINNTGEEVVVPAPVNEAGLVSVGLTKVTVTPAGDSVSYIPLPDRDPVEDGKYYLVPEGATVILPADAENGDTYRFVPLNHDWATSGVEFSTDDNAHTVMDGQAEIPTTQGVLTMVFQDGNFVGFINAE